MSLREDVRVELHFLHTELSAVKAKLDNLCVYFNEQIDGDETSERCIDVEDARDAVESAVAKLNRFNDPETA